MADPFGHVTFLGHSTVRLEIAGLRVLTDPVLFERVTFLRRHTEPIDAAFYDSVDLVAVSHLHFDHMDLRSLALLGRRVPILVPTGAGAWLRGQGFDEVVELRPGGTMQLGGLRVTATRALHDGFRSPFGPRAGAVGYLFEGGGASVYFAGDTDLFAEMAQLASDLDLALLPVWGWGPRLGAGHMDPERAADAVRLLRPRMAIPIHWGTFWPAGLGRLRPGRRYDPPHEFARAVARRGLAVEVRIAEPGARVPFRA